MSSPIWTRCGGKSKFRRLSAEAWRVVEDQSQIATRKLVDSDLEQIRLEQLLETVKPTIPAEPEWSNLHYLLFTPFRYPPLPHGSRFGSRRQRGIWYGSDDIDTALSEVAYWRLRLLNDTDADIHSEVNFTVFGLLLRSTKAVDLTVDPFKRYESDISSPVTYAASQPLGMSMVEDGVTFCRYRSARDPQRGTNIAVFSPSAFVSKRLRDNAQENWYCFASKTIIEFRRQGVGHDKRLRFQRADFEIDGTLPSMVS